MEEANLLLESIKFMVLGMTVVFTFLILLIIVVNFQAKIIGIEAADRSTLPAAPILRDVTSN